MFIALCCHLCVSVSRHFPAVLGSSLLIINPHEEKVTAGLPGATVTVATLVNISLMLTGWSGDGQSYCNCSVTDVDTGNGQRQACESCDVPAAQQSHVAVRHLDSQKSHRIFVGQWRRSG